MFDSLRDSMSWLHTWSGLILGSILFAVFWMGSLTVFDREIDRWMMPESRLQFVPDQFSLEAVVAKFIPQESSRWQVVFPTSRSPVAGVYYLIDEGYERVDVDPNTLSSLAVTETMAGTGFIFRFHYSLHIRWNEVGLWIVGLAAMSMLVLLVSGVIIHKKIFSDFFTFRPKKKLARSSLDLHNISGVLALPFHFAITLSGLIIYIAIYFAPVIDRTYGEHTNTFLQDSAGIWQREPAHTPAGPLSSLDSMIEQSSDIWGGSSIVYVRGWNLDDSNGTIEVRRTRLDDVSLNFDWISFDADSGELIDQHTAKPVTAAQRWITGFHFIQFDHWALRWLFFVLGIAGCVLIATGFLVWLGTRRKTHKTAGFQTVESLTVASVTGIIIATLAFFIGNRLLPVDANWLGIIRSDIEQWIFFLAWAGAFIHAFSRTAKPGIAWAEQCCLISAFSVLAVVLNSMTTGDHLFNSISTGKFAVAGMDLMLMFGALVTAYAAHKIYSAQRKHQQHSSGNLDKFQAEQSN